VRMAHDAAPDVASAPAELSLEETQTTVLAWMEAKARAFGAQHDVAALDAVLHGPMLEEWRERALTHRENDWHWSYQPSDVVV
jgi:ARC6-like, IMS domain